MREMYRPPAYDTFRVDALESLLYIPSTNERLLVPNDIVRTFDALAAFRTPEEHSAVIASLRGCLPDEAATFVRTLIASGFLRPLENPLAKPPLKTYPQPITTVAINTRDRPATLRRCLESYCRNASRAGRCVTFCVIDSSHPDRAEETRAVTREVCSSVGLAYEYVGRRERALLARRATDAGIPDGVVQFAIEGEPSFSTTTGASINTGLLLHCGERILKCDDDTICRMFQTEASRKGISFSSLFCTSELVHYDTTEGPYASATPIEADICGLHEDLLGKAVSEILIEAPSPYDYDAPISQFLMRILELGVGRIRATMPGVLGDCGFGGASGITLSHGRTREHAVSSIESYRRACTSRQVLMVPPSHVVSDSPFFMSYCCGIDLTSPTVPFLPVGRNSDGFFSSILRRVSRVDLIAHLPFAIEHRPQVHRSFSPQAVRLDVTRMGISEAIIQLAYYFRPDLSGSDLESRLAVLGRTISSLTHLEDRDLLADLSRAYWQADVQYISALEMQLEKYKAQPEWWAQDVREQIRLVKEWMVSDRRCLPYELREQDLPVDRALAEFRRLCAAVGELLLYWHDLVRVCQKIAPDVRASAPFR